VNLCRFAFILALAAWWAPLSASTRDQTAASEKSAVERNCEAGDVAACLNAGRILVQLSGEARAIRAREMFARGCELGSADACHLLVPMLIEGRGGAQLLDVAAEVAEVLCEAQSGQGCNWQANILSRQAAAGQEIDYGKLIAARELYLKGCELGAMEACGQAGALLATGTTGLSDPARGYDLLERACRGEQWQACANAAIMARDGLAHDADWASARDYFGMACDGGIASACNDLGIMWMQLADRSGDERWRDPALLVFIASCDGGDGAGCSNAARQLREGRGVPADPVRAYDLALRGCDAKSARACLLASEMRRTGDGVESDQESARELRQKACDLGRPAACDLVDSTAD
jgi:hypothetical protein